MNSLRLIDELEQLVEESKGMLGKRLVEEEAFFHKMQQLRTALPRAMKDVEDAARASSGNAAFGAVAPLNAVENAAALNEVFASARALSRGEQLRLIAQLSAELARHEL